PSPFPATDTRHLAPVHFTSSKRAEPLADVAAFTRSTGVTISCSDTPPCEYSMEARKHPAPGGLAIATPGLQCHLNAGASIWASGFSAAHRPHRDSARNTFRSTFGRPPGIRSQP